MVKREKEAEEPKHSIDDTEFDKTVEGLVESIMKNLEDGYDNPLMPFDTYVEKQKLEVEADVKTFRMRLRKGYIEILRALMSRKDLKKEEKEQLMRHLASKHINSLEGDFRIYP